MILNSRVLRSGGSGMKSGRGELSKIFIKGGAGFFARFFTLGTECARLAY